jgi:uncharacterized repeat protein (TIGR03803 family)
LSLEKHYPNDAGNYRRKEREAMKIETAKLLVVFCSVAVHGPGQTLPIFNTLYIFAGPDGANPLAAPIGRNGVLYGTTYEGGASGFGTVFSLTPPATPGGSLSEQVLYSFTGQSDGGYPTARLLISSSGVLFGTSNDNAQSSYDYSTIFALIPPAAAGGAWTHKTVHAIRVGLLGSNMVEQAGVLHVPCGSGICSVTPPAAPGGSWALNLIYPYTNTEGDSPVGLAAGQDGALYGTMYYRGKDDAGEVFSLTPPASPGNFWIEQVLYTFTAGSDGAEPSGPPTIGADGVLYGVTVFGGITPSLCYNGCGTVFSLTPPALPGGSWTEETIYQFTGGTDGGYPSGCVAIGNKGQLYGTTYGGVGTVWELAPPSNGGSWTFRILQAFDGAGDGVSPMGGLWMGEGGVLYGTTFGEQGSITQPPPWAGTVFSVIP